MINKKVQALIQLLDDPDDEVFNQVRSELISMGNQIIPDLENFWEHNNYEPVFRNRVENLIHDIQFGELCSDLEIWVKNPESLLEGVLLINRYKYPETIQVDIEKKITDLARSIWLELNDNLTAMEIIQIFNQFFYTEYNFKGDRKSFHSPNNSYLKDVLETKRGNPLSLSIVYQLLAEKLHLPIKGVNLPSHFVLAYLDDSAPIFPKIEKYPPILFYINPFSSGSLLNRTDIKDFLKQLNIEEKDSFYEPCSNHDMIKRMVVNLVYSYSKVDDNAKMEEMKVLEKILKGE